jgi:hypothetical protein
LCKARIAQDYTDRLGIIGAIRAVINYYNSDVRAKALCETFEADCRRAQQKTALPDWRTTNIFMTRFVVSTLGIAMGE